MLDQSDRSKIGKGGLGVARQAGTVAEPIHGRLGEAEQVDDGDCERHHAAQPARWLVAWAPEAEKLHDPMQPRPRPEVAVSECHRCVVDDPRWWVGDDVTHDEFVSQRDAAKALHLRLEVTVRHYVARGILSPATSPDGERGVTRTSLDAEREWQRRASSIQRLRRRLGGLVHYL